MRSAAALVAIIVLTISASGIALAAGDPARGAALHEACLGCHGTELYVPPKAKIKTLSALKKEVDRWNDRYNPKFSKQEIEDLVVYLNRDFYKLAK
ncbi:MAG: c-type cytochrome [Betaproteobacteria bacterium]